MSALAINLACTLNARVDVHLSTDGHMLVFSCPVLVLVLVLYNTHRCTSAPMPVQSPPNLHPYL